MRRAIVCHPPGLLHDKLLHKDVWYQVEGDGCLNPQPTPARFAEMMHFTSTFAVRSITEERAGELDWPDEWAIPPAEEGETPGPVEPPRAPDFEAMSWNEFRSYASEQGVKVSGKNREQILNDLAELDGE